MLTDAGRKQLIEDEGYRNKVYNDATGEPLGLIDGVGYPTIGVGRNLLSRGLTDIEVEYLLNNDIVAFWGDIVKLLPWLSNFAIAHPVRADVILMVEFNTGNVFQFRKMLAACLAENFDEAAAQLLDSKAATQGPARYQRMAHALATNVWAGAAPVTVIDGTSGLAYPLTMAS